jgi:asparagine synthase (glutamine-hydrolysing)
LTGFIDLERRLAVTQLAGITERMTDVIAHRGPDDSAPGSTPRRIWRSAFGGFPSSTCRPWAAAMHSASGRFVIVYNGEIYNAPELRRQLETEGLAFAPLRH